MNDIHPIFKPLLNQLSQPSSKIIRVTCHVCFGTKTSYGAMSYDSNVETYGGPCSRCRGEGTLEVRI